MLIQLQAQEGEHELTMIPVHMTEFPLTVDALSDRLMTIIIKLPTDPYSPCVVAARHSVSRYIESELRVDAYPCTHNATNACSYLHEQSVQTACEMRHLHYTRP